MNKSFFDQFPPELLEAAKKRWPTGNPGMTMSPWEYGGLKDYGAILQYDLDSEEVAKCLIEHPETAISRTIRSLRLNIERLQATNTAFFELRQKMIDLLDPCTCDHDEGDDE
jgi:hypothetical protein